MSVNVSVAVARQQLANYRTRMIAKYGTREFAKKWLVRERNAYATYCRNLAKALRMANMGTEYVAPTPLPTRTKVAPEIPDENRPKPVTLSRPEQWAAFDEKHGRPSNALRSTAVIRSGAGVSLDTHLAQVSGEPRKNTAAWFLWKSAQSV